MRLTRDDPFEPHPRRLPIGHPRRAEVLAAHAAAVAAGHPTYRDPVSGLSVFTAAFHLARGRCCESGCRHCPYVPLDGPLDPSTSGPSDG